MQIVSYPKLWAIGTKHVASIFDDPVIIQEKVDGSQFSFCVIDGELFCRSKGKQLIVSHTESMFALAVEYLNRNKQLIPENILFRCECFQRPKHNVLKYDRVPKNFLMLYDAQSLDGTEFYSNPDQLEAFSNQIGIECVPFIYVGKIDSADRLFDLLDRVSVLGGQKIEGVVVKNYTKQYWLGGQLQPFMAGKFVSEKFKEVASSTWKTEHTAKGGFDAFKEAFNTEARFKKAIQHLREAGLLDESPKDIGPLIKEIQRDIIEEEKESIKDALWMLFNKDILRTAVRGFPEKYKEWLVESSFEGNQCEE